MNLRGDTNRASDLRHLHLAERGFVYLPVLEEIIERYENDREQYPNFGMFLPELVDAFGDVDTSSTDYD